MSIDTAHDVLAPRLPVPVREGQIAVVQAEALWELPVRSIKLIHVMLSYTRIHPFYDTITFSRQKAADILAVSTRSVSRYLKDLEVAGVIERLPQRQKNGVWDCLTVRWTKRATEKYLRIPSCQKGKPLPPRKDPPDGDSQRGTHKSHISGFLKNKEDKKTADAASSSNSPSFPSDELKRLMPATPRDLIEPALSLGLNRVQVATLMKNCKLVGQRLQDFFALYAEALVSRRITGRQALAWLLTVIKRGSDVTWTLAQRRQEVRHVEKRTKNRRTLDRVGQALAAKPVVLPDGAVLTEVSGGLAVLRSQTGFLSSCPIDQLARFLLRHHVRWTIDLLRHRHPVPAVVPLFPTTAFPDAPAGAAGTPNRLKRCFSDLKALLKKRPGTLVPVSGSLPTGA